MRHLWSLPVLLTALMLAACDEPLAVEDGAVAPETPDKVAPAIVLTAPSGQVVTGNFINLRGTATDSVGVVAITYSYVGGPPVDVEIIPGTRVSFDMEIPVVAGIHPLQVHAYDAAGNSASTPQVLVPATTAELNLAVTEIVDSGEGYAGYTSWYHVRGTAPGVERIEYHHLQVEKAGWQRYGEGEIPVADDGSVAAIVENRGPAFVLEAYDSAGVMLRRSYSNLLRNLPVISVSPEPAERFLPQTATSVHLRISASAALEGDTIKRIYVVEDGERREIDVSGRGVAEFDWFPTLASPVTELAVRVETGAGYIRTLRFQVVRTADAGAAGRYATVASGSTFTCAATPGGESYCWGRFPWAPGEDSPLPVRSFPGHSFSTLAAGHSDMCGLDQRGTAYCWGQSGSLLGEGSATVGSPQVVSQELTFSHLAVAGARACGIAGDGRGYCWGQRAAAHLDDEDGNSPVPIEVPGGHAYRDLALGHSLDCGVTTAGEVLCWEGRWVLEPLLMAGGSAPFTAVAVQGGRVCALDENGDAWCSSTGWKLTRFTEGLRLESITAGLQATCAASKEGAAYCWGSGPVMGEHSAYPPTVVPMPGGIEFHSLSAWLEHMCGVTSNNAVYCWGQGLDGQLGNGTRYNLPSPVRAFDP